MGGTLRLGNDIVIPAIIGEGSTINNQNKTVTSNGVYTADQGYTGLGRVTVNVNNSTETKTITENGTYTPSSGKVGFSSVTVNVAVGSAGLPRYVIYDSFDDSYTYTSHSQYSSEDVTSFSTGGPTNVFEDYSMAAACRGNTKLTDIEFLPSGNEDITLGQYSWAWAFAGCTSLTDTTLSGHKLITSRKAPGSCEGMFAGCTSLTSTGLEANTTNTLGKGAWADMFSGCTSLTSTGLSNITSLCLDKVGVTLYEILRPDYVDYYEQINYGNMARMFAGCTSLLSTGLSKLEQFDFLYCNYASISCTREKITASKTDIASDPSAVGEYVCAYMFAGCTSLTDIGLDKLTNIPGHGAFKMFLNCTGLESASFPELTEVYDNAMEYMFSGCTNLQTISFPKLATMGRDACYHIASNSGLSSIYFRGIPKSKMNEIIANRPFRYMLSSGTSGLRNCTVHFPANLSDLATEEDFVNGFGGTSTTILFDLPNVV